ncbi:MAG: HAMP domain-containing histidine kinase [Lawsonibacter sp.]|nr:HAMP domain-containing histidine kinase [Lawsonibacter sp.]
MLNSMEVLLDSFPEGVLQIRDGVVAAANAAARRYLPHLEPGFPCPELIPPLRDTCAGTGTFAAGDLVFRYSCTACAGEQIIIFNPVPQASRAALTGRQLEGVLRQLRTLLGEVLAEVGPATAGEGPQVPAGDFGKSFHRLFRLINNLEFMQQSAGAEGVPFRPVTMDLDGLCRHTMEGAYPLLKEAGVELEYETPLRRGLLIPGDPELLQRLLLGLIANAAQAVGEGRVLLSLRRQGEWALLSISDNGPLPDPRQVAAMLQEDAGTDLPLPGQGAGLGLPIAWHIVELHRGRRLVGLGQSTPSVLISLPTGPLDGRLSLHTPLLQQDGGLDPVLTELADVLPAHLFAMEALD